MLLVIAALYSLLALFVHIRLEGALWEGQGSLCVQVSAAALQLRSDAQICLDQSGLRIVPRSRRREKRRAGRLGGKLAFRLMKIALRRGWLRQIRVQARIGLGDACHTALAAGALQALAAALLRDARGKTQQRICIEPDFGGACLNGHICCIFSCRLGNMMFAVLKAAASKTGKKPGKRDSDGKASH